MRRIFIGPIVIGTLIIMVMLSYNLCTKKGLATIFKAKALIQKNTNVIIDKHSNNTVNYTVKNEEQSKTTTEENVEILPEKAEKINSGKSNETNTSKNEVTKVVQLSNVQSNIENQLYQYMNYEKNQLSVLDTAQKLHDGNLHNACVYFVSESLRRIGINIPKSTSTTDILTSELKSKGWKVNSDLTKLLPGDICFTTLESDKVRPVHTYIFMGWKEPGNYNYAYICDNQAYKYGISYHIRNINFAINNSSAFSYFMYK